jgi:hypothetical protein
MCQQPATDKFNLGMGKAHRHGLGMCIKKNKKIKAKRLENPQARL